MSSTMRVDWCLNSARNASVHLLGILSLLSGIIVASGQGSFAADYPQKPIRLVVGFGQGGPTDVVARLLAEAMTVDLKQRVYVENRPGASGNVATQAVASADADGYTFMIGASPFAVNHSLFPDFPVKFEKDLVALRSIGATTNILVVHSSLDVKNVKEFRERAAKTPSLSYITLGKGSSSHLAGVEFDRLAGTQMTPVPYRSTGEAVSDLTGGHVQAWFASAPAIIEQVKAGRARALAVTGPSRLPALPDVPTLDETEFPGFDVRLWVGVFSPTGVPRDRLDIFTTSLDRALASAQGQKVLAEQGMEPLPMSRDQFTDFVKTEIKKWSELVSKLM